MDNKKRDVHNSGPLGMLLKTGQIKKIENTYDAESNVNKENNNKNFSYFKTTTGIEFKEDELIFINTSECEPWKYANRHDEELGDIENLIESIRKNKQLQPAVVRNHPNPHNGIKYEILFGRRRYIACKTLNIPLLAICKNIDDDKQAVAIQNAENKFRNNVSNYSNAVLYKKLLEDRIFSTGKELAEHLQISTSTLNDILAYTKIPDDIVKNVINIHQLSNSMAIAIVALIKKSKDNHAKLITLANQIGEKITSPNKLELALEEDKTKIKEINKAVSKIYKNREGKKIFVLKHNSRGNASLEINKEILGKIELVRLCDYVNEQINLQLKEYEQKV